MKFLFIFFFYFASTVSLSFGKIVNEIRITGNERITDETVLMFSDLNIGDNLNDTKINQILKSLYETNFFNNVSVNLENGIFFIKIDEAPLIQNIIISGVNAKKYEDIIRNTMSLKSKSSFNKYFLSNDLKSIKSKFKSIGFYFTDVEAYIDEIDNNLVNIELKIDIGDKSKISRISFIGDKIYKNKKLKSIIVSEEYKFWKFISGKKYLQEQLINIDKRLLKNFYLNKGFYNVSINTSFAKLIKENEFELIFNIEAGKRINFGKLNINLPNDFNINNYDNINKIFKKLEGEPYSINSVNKILDEIDNITIQDEFKTVNATVEEEIIENKLNINFIIQETEKFFVERINIYGNNITRESVIRNQLEIDEGDPFSFILSNKSENNIKSLNFFKSVNTEVINGSDENSKIINIKVEEKATGEISAGAGGGTEGATIFVGIKENNYLGKGLGLDANATLTEDSFKGKFTLINPNFNDSDKSLVTSVQAIEIDQLTNFGYKTNKTGFLLGTNFEYLKDFNIGLSTENFYEKIETDDTASVRQKKQAGNYFDSFLDLNFNLDKRNQKFKTTDGYFSNYGLKLPILSDTNTVTNSYNYKLYSELYENNISSFSIFLKSAASINNNDIKLSERLFLPSSRLRGFKSGKIGPKDGDDFIGGNYIASMNLQSTLPILFENSQDLDAIIFFDAANVWGVDYDSSLGDGSKIRSSIGIGIDWLTPVGPLNFSLTEVITKYDTDLEESFRFNLGTTF